MKSDFERCAEHEQFRKIDAAFRAGDLAALRAAVNDPDIVPNGPMPLAIGPCLSTRSLTAHYPSSVHCLRMVPIPSRRIMPGFRRSSRHCHAATHIEVRLDVWTWLKSSNCCCRSEQIPINAA